MEDEEIKMDDLERDFRVVERLVQPIYWGDSAPDYQKRAEDATLAELSEARAKVGKKAGECRSAAYLVGELDRKLKRTGSADGWTVSDGRSDGQCGSVKITRESGDSPASVILEFGWLDGGFAVRLSTPALTARVDGSDSEHLGGFYSAAAEFFKNKEFAEDVCDALKRQLMYDRGWLKAEELLRNEMWRRGNARVLNGGRYGGF